MLCFNNYVSKSRTNPLNNKGIYFSFLAGFPFSAKQYQFCDNQYSSTMDEWIFKAILLHVSLLWIRGGKFQTYFFSWDKIRVNIALPLNIIVHKLANGENTLILRLINRLVEQK